MESEAQNQALDRLDRAVAALERALAQPAPAPDALLAARHAHLKTALSDAIGRIDRLIADGADA